MNESQLTPCTFSYSASSVKKSCFVFHVKSGDRSARTKNIRVFPSSFKDEHTGSHIKVQKAHFLFASLSMCFCQIHFNWLHTDLAINLRRKNSFLKYRRNGYGGKKRHDAGREEGRDIVYSREKGMHVDVGGKRHDLGAYSMRAYKKLPPEGPRPKWLQLQLTESENRNR